MATTTTTRDVVRLVLTNPIQYTPGAESVLVPYMRENPWKQGVLANEPLQGETITQEDIVAEIPPAVADVVGERWGDDEIKAALAYALEQKMGAPEGTVVVLTQSEWAEYAEPFQPKPEPKLDGDDAAPADDE